MEIENDSLPAGPHETYTIRAINVPQQFFQNRDATKKYFRRFGKVKLIMFKPKRQALLVEYASNEGKLNALEVAGEYNGHFFKVVEEKNSPVRKKKAKKDPDPAWLPDADIREELQAMGGFSPRTFALRSDAMNTDSVESPDALKSKQKWKSSSPKPKKIETKLTLGSREQEDDLLSIIKQQAHSTEDKYKILDARDKLIRLRHKKSMEFIKTQATVGICPDMCPEKERLMREIQHQVALYEQEETGKGMNYKVAVKQYSRSSADQETPLPQELRPVSVLQMTMGYLMHNIMGLCDSPDVNVGEWYHFLWDRTRGIRKDITQQELCSQGAVELVEQCARFHIFCSARLVSEDPSAFDQKINTENLTKCLQTLKYMYHDLQLKGESCGNEAEFRAYIILLNLNDGNFMWEVQQLQFSIQESKEVKFALEIYSALDKNNYVKFFKLVNSTTYLNACILMRYFVQVRLSALKTLLKCYSPRVSQTSLPIIYLSRILAFENVDATTEFLETYGLYTTVERDRVILDRRRFSQPDYPYVLDRAIKLIESKRRVSIGEVVCGKDLPPKTFESHILQNSFDDRGFLKNLSELTDKNITEEEPEMVEDNETPKEEKIFQLPTAQKIFARPPLPPPPIVTHPGIFTLPPVAIPSIFAPKLEKPPVFNWATPPKQSIFGNEISEEKKHEMEAEKRRREEEERIRKQREEFEKRREEQERERKRQEEIRHKQELLEAQRKVLELKMRKLEEEKLKLIEKRRREEVQLKRDVAGVITEIINKVETKIKDETLIRISKKIHKRRVKNFVRKWREYARRKRKRKAIDFNPFYLPVRTTKEEARELYTKSQDLALADRKRYKRGQPLDITLEEKPINSIDLSELTFKFLTKKVTKVDMKVQTELFWKITVSLPDDLEFRYGLNHVEQVLSRYIQWKERKGGTFLIQQSQTNPTVTYCLEKQKGIVSLNKSDSNGYIFIANDFNEKLCNRINNCLGNYGIHAKIPIVVVLQKYQTVENQSQLQIMLKDGLISDYLIIVDQFTTSNLVNVIEEGLVFLSTKVEKSPPLEMDVVSGFLSRHLSVLWKRANSFAKWNSNYKECLKSPNTVIYLYNEAVDKMKSILIDPTCRDFAVFPELFKTFLRSEIPDCLPCDFKYFPSFWRNPVYLGHIEEVLDSLKLPKFVNWPLRSEQLEKNVLDYSKLVSRNSQATFYRIMSVLLKPGDVLWTEIVELIVNDKLNQTDFSFYGTGFVNKSIYNQLTVVYNVDKLNEFIQSDWFYVNHPIVRHQVLDLLENSTEEEVEEVLDEDEGEVDVDQLFKSIVEKPRGDVSKIVKEVNMCKNLMDELEDTVNVSRRILEVSGNILNKVMGK